MYVLTWNSQQGQIEANFGGYVSKKEATAFTDELRSHLLDRGEAPFSVLVDYSTASKLDKDVQRMLEEARETCLFSGAAKITFITRDEHEASALTTHRLQSVLEGRERYTANRSAA